MGTRAARRSLYRISDLRTTEAQGTTSGWSCRFANVDARQSLVTGPLLPLARVAITQRCFSVLDARRAGLAALANSQGYSL